MKREGGKRHLNRFKKEFQDQYITGSKERERDKGMPCKNKSRRK